MFIRLTSGGKTGQVIEVNDTHVVRAWINSGRAEIVGPEVEPDEVAEASEVVETPEKPAGRGRRKAAAEKPETR